MKINDIQVTPNPNALLLELERKLTSEGSFLTSEFNPEYPLITLLMTRESVSDVFVTGSQLTVAFDPKVASDGNEELEWLIDTIHDFEPPIEVKGQEIASSPEGDKIQDVIDREIGPYLRSHGGDARVLKVTEDKEVWIRYLGACGGCPSASRGTLQALEKLIQTEVDGQYKVVLK